MVTAKTLKHNENNSERCNDWVLNCGPDCISVLVLKKCKSELSLISV